jgi:hypothetical protein
MWYTIHHFASKYNESKKKDFLNFIFGLKEFLCEICKAHFQEIIIYTLPLETYVENRKLVFLWSYLAHDKVNRSKNRDSPSFLEIYKFYNSGLTFDSHIWITFHTVSSRYHPSQSKEFIRFLGGLLGLLENQFQKNFTYATNIFSVNDYLINNKQLFFWSYLIHNEVNRLNGKESPPFQKVFTFYFQ